MIEREFCADAWCPESYVPHRWGRIAASRAGWCLQRNGDSWCPNHIPDWVAEWRKSKTKEQS